MMTRIAMPGTIPVRPGHAFDAAALSNWLSSHVAGFAGPIDITQFEGGQSNPTFLLRSPGGACVLRKKPPGTLLPSAHLVEREYRVMHALASTPVPVPACLALCGDASIIGTTFFVMAFVEGRTFWDPAMPDVAPDDRRRIWEGGFDVLADLHAVDPASVGLADFGRPGDYFSRQIARWSGQYDAAATEDVPAMRSLAAWLPANIPPRDETALVHGDYRIDNLLIAPDAPRVAAVLDWELATLGHPLADVAYACLPFYVMPDGSRRPANFDLEGVDGIPTHRSLVERYAARTGRDPLASWPFYVAFSLFRLASIAQGVYKRSLQGNASSASAARYRHAARQLSELAGEIAGGER